jgi:hypothetical protein
MAFDVNPVAVVLGVVLMMVLGFLWYGPLFGRIWMAARGVTPEQMRMANPGPAYASTVVAALITAVAMALLLSAAGARGAGPGAALGALVAVGVVATSQVSNGVFENRPWVVTLLYAAYQLVGLTLMGAIVGALR